MQLCPEIEVNQFEDLHGLVYSTTGTQWQATDRSMLQELKQLWGEQ